MYSSSLLLLSIVYSSQGIPLWSVLWEDVIVPVLKDLDGTVVVPLGKLLEHLVLRSTVVVGDIQPVVRWLVTVPVAVDGVLPGDIVLDLFFQGPAELID